MESQEDTTVKNEEPANPLLQRPQRRVILSPKADIVRTAPDGTRTTTESYRAVFKLLDAFNDLPDDGEYEVYLKEDEEKSDIPGKGEGRYRRMLLPSKASKAEAMKWLANNYLDPRQTVLELQRMCTTLAMHSQLKNIMVTMVFDGSRPSGFTFFTDCSEQTVSDIEALGNASRRMADGYMDDMRKQHPNEVSFETDGDIILPSSVDTERMARSAATAQRLMRAKAEGR